MSDRFEWKTASHNQKAFLYIYTFIAFLIAAIIAANVLTLIFTMGLFFAGAYRERIIQRIK